MSERRTNTENNIREQNQANRAANRLRGLLVTIRRRGDLSHIPQGRIANTASQQTQAQAGQSADIQPQGASTQAPGQVGLQADPAVHDANNHIAEAMHDANNRLAQANLRISNLGANLRERSGIRLSPPPQVRRDNAWLANVLPQLERLPVAERLRAYTQISDIVRNNAATAMPANQRHHTSGEATRAVLERIGFIDSNVWFEDENLYGEVIWTMGGNFFLPPGYIPYHLRDGDATLYHHAQSDHVFDSSEVCHAHYEHNYGWQAPGTTRNS